MRLDRPDAHQGLTFGPNGSWIQHSCFNAFCFPQMKPFLFLIFACKYTTLNCDVTVVRQMCAYFYFVFLFSHAASHRTHRTHSVTHPLISWLSCITYCSLSAWKLTWTAATHHTWPGGSQCVCVFLCVPGALQSLASFSAWFSWWVLWRPCACACACAWRMGEGHVLACSAPPISILWPRAIQVGLQKCGAREMEFTRKQNGRCQRWRKIREREKKNIRIRWNKNACFRQKENDHLEVILYVLDHQNLTSVPMQYHHAVLSGTLLRNSQRASLIYHVLICLPVSRKSVSVVILLHKHDTRTHIAEEYYFFFPVVVQVI